MSNTWQALRRGESVRERRLELERAHERFLDSLGGLTVAGQLGPDVEAELRERLVRFPGVRPLVLESWLRSGRGTIDPNRVLEQPALTDEELAELRRTHPISQVLPMVRRLLFDEARESGMIVAVGDAAGRLLWVDGDTKLQDRAGEMGFRPGMDWSERAMGTSAPGSALALGHPIQVLGAEHFNRAVHEWSCTAAPVHDPQTGAVIGVVDVTGGDSAASPHLLPLLQATLAAIEAELQLASLRMLLTRAPQGLPFTHSRAQETFHAPFEGALPGASAGAGSGVGAGAGAGAAAGPDGDAGGRTAAAFPASSGLDSSSVQRQATRVPAAAEERGFVPRLLVLGREPAILEWQAGATALSGRHAEILLALSEAPRGLGAATLAEQVYGQRSSEQTLRAELVRLRRWLAAEEVPLSIRSRPYGLEGQLRVDAADTLAALERAPGYPVFATYAGPVLPGSTAPIAERLRAEVDATLREAMLEFARPDALYDYAQRWASADVQVWETLLQVLPPDSPKRARVVARLESL